MTRIVQVGMLLCLALGLGVGFWGGRKLNKNVPSPSQGTAIQLLQQELAYALSQVKKVTAQSQRELGSLQKVYQDSIKKLQRLETHQLEGYATARTAADSFKVCSVVLITCQQRADLAESRVEGLRAQLARQTALQPRPCGLIVTGGPVAGVQYGKKLSGFAAVAQIGMTTGCRISLPFLH